MEALIFITVIFLNFLLSIFFQKIFLNKKIIDEVNARSSHNKLATRSGGISMFIIVFFTAIFFYLKGNEIFDFSIIIPTAILFTIGLYDDLYKADFKLKFIFQVIAAKILIDYGFVIDNFHGFLGIFELNRIFAQLFTIFIVVAIVNSINFIDGIDGLASSVVGIFIIYYEFFSKYTSDFRILSVIILGLIFSFLYFNIRLDKKVFLGDSGSLFLGGIVSIYTLTILSDNYYIKPEYDINKILFVISILTFPIIDITRVFFIRILNKKSPFVADKNHIHHLLLKKINNQKIVLIIILFFSLLFTTLVQLFI